MIDKIELMYSSKQLALLEHTLNESLAEVIRSGEFIMGPEVKKFEDRVCEYADVKNALGCANGTDALTISLMALGLEQGDVIFTPSFTFIATAEAIAILGATPYFVDVNSHDFNISPESLTESIEDATRKGMKVKGVITVNLFGNPVDYAEINKICEKHNLFHISDAAQSFGAKYQGQHALKFADITTTSFFPTKPLGCYGDGGMVFTENTDIANTLRSLTVHGKGKNKYDNVRVGMNSRLDSIQACVLNHKLDFFTDEILKRNKLAEFYNDNISDIIQKPGISVGNQSAWAVYSLIHKERDKILEKLKDKQIPSNVYYRVPLHLQPAYTHFPRVKNMSNSEKYAKEVFCLPMHAYVSDQQSQYIVTELNKIIEDVR